MMMDQLFDRAIETLTTDKNLGKLYIGDRFVIKGESFTCVGNYPLHSYLLAKRNRAIANAKSNKTVKIMYNES